MKIVSWNINGLKSHFNDLINLVEMHRPDFICLQKVRCSTERINYKINGYEAVYTEVDCGNWSEVMMYFKKSLETLQNSSGENFPIQLLLPIELSNNGHLQAFKCNDFILVKLICPMLILL